MEGWTGGVSWTPTWLPFDALSASGWKANPAASEAELAIARLWLARPQVRAGGQGARRCGCGFSPIVVDDLSSMSLFAAARLVRSPLAMDQSVLSAARLSPRALHTSSKVGAITWSKQPPAKTVPVSQEQDLKNLNRVRNERPISPHLTIYQPQLTWYSSIANRITGVGLSALLYTYAIGYLAAPYLGLGEALSSGVLLTHISHLPLWLKLTVKAPLAAVFSYHLFNGIRHLSWDLNKCMYCYHTNPQSRRCVARTPLATPCSPLRRCRRWVSA